MKPLRLWSVALFMGLLLLTASSNPAQQIISTDQEGAGTPAVGGLLFGATAGGVGSFPSVFYSIDPSTGAATAIGSIGFRSVSAMDFHPVTGVLYATGRRVSDGRLVLITINPATGAGTEVGPLGSGFNVQDMSFRNSDATLFAYIEGSLYTVNTATGAATRVGFVNFFPEGNAIAFSPTDTLYYANEAILGQINPATGALTTVVLLHFPVGSGGFSRVAAMDFRPGFSSPYGTVITNAETYLATIDTATGEVTRIGQTAARMDALTWSPSGSFDTCIKDDGNGRLLLFNSATGDYVFTDCGKGDILIGRASISREFCKLSLSDSGPDPKRPDRSVTVLVNTCTRVADAVIGIFSSGRNFTIHDSDTANSACACR
jgi:hypothetical protein